jgi:hypothetical protein
MAILITTLHTSCDSRRATEYLACLQTNLAHPAVDVIKVLLETKNNDDYGFLQDIKHEKLEIITTDKRPFFSDLFAIANQCGNDQVAVIYNADIYFDQDSNLERVHEIDSRQFWTISRYDEQKDGKWAINRLADGGSHDCWVFRTPIRQFSSEYHLGILGCDQIIAQRAVEAGFLVLNPCLTIKTRHQHRYNIRNNTLDRKGLSYWHEKDFLRLGVGVYCAPSSTLESPIICSNKSLLYFVLGTSVGRWLQSIYRSMPLTKQLLFKKLIRV